MTSVHGQSVGKWKLLVKQAINLRRTPTPTSFNKPEKLLARKVVCQRNRAIVLAFGQSAEMKYLFWCHCSSRSRTLFKTFLITFYKADFYFWSSLKTVLFSLLYTLWFKSVANGAESGIKYSNWRDMQSAVCVWVAQGLLDHSDNQPTNLNLTSDWKSACPSFSF